MMARFALDQLLAGRGEYGEPALSAHLGRLGRKGRYSRGWLCELEVNPPSWIKTTHIGGSRRENGHFGGKDCLFY